MNPTEWQNITALGILGMVVVGFMLFLAKKLDTIITAITEMHVSMKSIEEDQRTIRISLHNFRNRLMDYMNLPKGEKE